MLRMTMVIAMLNPVFSIFGKHVDDDEEVEKAAELDNENTNDCEESNMYARMKHQSCLCLKSAAIQNPFAIYQRRKFHK